MTIKTEGVHAGEFLLSEANGTRSREEVTLAATTGILPAGQLLGIIAASGEYAPYTPAANDGTETVAAVLWAPAGISTSPQRSVGLVRDAEVARALLVGLDTAGEADLLARGIIVRG